MGMSRSQGYTRIGRPDSGNSYGLTGNSAYQKSLDQMGSFNTFSLGSGSNHFWRRNEAQPQMPDITPRYANDDSEQRYQLNIDAATDVADKLKDYGDKLFDVFDNYQTNFQYWATTPRYRMPSWRAGWGRRPATIRPMRTCNSLSTNGICAAWA